VIVNRTQNFMITNSGIGPRPPMNSASGHGQKRKGYGRREADVAGPAPEPIIVLPDRLVAADIPRLCRLLITLLAGGCGWVICDASGLAHPDLVAVEALARLQLTARRHGSTLRLRRAGPQLCALLELLGLSGTIPPEP
jgi:ABC-type transporter Mla MlaB component